MTQMTHYDVLEVSPKASSEVIRAAYKSLMQRYHPDKNALESTARAPSIALAYDVLSNPDKRLAYDQELNALALLDHQSKLTRQDSATHTGIRVKKPRLGRSLRVWYAWLIIVSIMAAGAMILGRSRINPVSTAPVQTSVHFSAAPPMALAEQFNERQGVKSVRTISAFMTRLSIDLHPDNLEANGVGHVLVIPNIGFRVEGEDSARWAKSIELQRTVLMQQILMRLATARYEELIKVDGEAYLKRIIEDTVSSTIGLTALDPLERPLVSGQALARPLTAMLPLSFSIQ